MYTSLTSIAFLLAAPLTNVNNRPYLIPSGENIVFKMNSKGVIVTGTYDVVYNKGKYNPLKDSDIKRGDLILKANNVNVDDINELTNIISNNKLIELEILRNKEIISRKLNIYTVDNLTRSGLYVKDKVIGVGTLTYIDPTNLYYGALGHEVIDNDTHNIATLKNGIISYNDVISISKGSNNHPGEKISQTSLNNIVGNITSNTNKGIFGEYNGKINKKSSLPIAYQDEITKGKATILTTTEGNVVKEYQITITDLKKQNNDQTKGITFKINDDKLLDIAGGVYSGMSGSPIIQNNHLIGAVTHVLIDDIKYGYGLYIENMFLEQNKYSTK